MDGLDSIVIGTAGHIDHGKTTLVKALTGHDTDTLAEEKRRGITINLGFTYFKLPCGRTAGVVDVPGHERFIKNMLAGSGGIDIAMVVIAANEGIMPQTKEHIHILNFLGIHNAVVVVTKIHMVDDDFRELVIEDTKEYLQKTFLKDAPFILVDSLSGTGIDTLIHTLDQMAIQVESRLDSKAARMPVDRAFSVKGFGTVVTGTLAEGAISLDDELMLYPDLLPVKVRGIQIHEQTVSYARAGQRTALNLTGVTVEQIQRGSVVAKRGSIHPTEVMEVCMSAVADAKRPIKRLDTVRLYIGSKEVSARVVPMNCPAVQPGETCYAQLLLCEPVIARRGDRFVLRTITPVCTVGGGYVIDPGSTRAKAGDSGWIADVKQKDLQNAVEILEAFVRKMPFSSEDQIEMVADVNDANGLKCLLEQGLVMKLEAGLIHRQTLEHLRNRLRGYLTAYHAEFALRSGMPKAELQEKMGFTEQPKAFLSLLNQFVSQQIISATANAVCLQGFQPTFSNDLQKIRDEMMSQIERSGYSPPEVKELTGNDKERREVLEKLAQTEVKILGGQVALSSLLYQKAFEHAQQLYAEHGTLSLPAFRDALGCSRKYALFVLEQFDREKLTQRQGEDRVLLKISEQ